MHEATPSAVLSGAESQSAFDGFPYLATRVVPGLYHITLMPEGLTLKDMFRVAQQQVRANQLKSCLVLDANLGVYFGLDGRHQWMDTVPSGGILITGRLRCAAEFLSTEEFEQRAARLEAEIRARWPSGCMFGDLTKGGRLASEADRACLEGLQPNGIPRGLTQCPVCGNWQGDCLDPSPQFAGQIMAVYCRCANNNRCARCWKPLADRRLNANYFSEADGHIWHVPGFSGFSHQCAE